MANNNLSSILAAISTAATAGQTNVVSQLAGFLHMGNQGHVDIKDKTITVAWEQANPASAALLMAQGYTIIPD
jgi:hypothetical protein